VEQVEPLQEQSGSAEKKTNVLFLCTGNSARSQMAEAFLRKYAGDRFEVFSAGLKPSTINPFTIRVMEEIDFDMAGHHAKSVRDFLGWSNFATIITVCAKAEENCPSTFPGKPSKLAWAFEDPAAFEGSDEAKLEKFRVVRNHIDAKIQDWIREEQSPA
jgi:arsenate reductase (thioredoxin)